MHWLRLVLFNIVPLLLALAAPMLLLWAWGNGLALLPALLVGLLFVSAALVIFLLGALGQPAEGEQHDLLWAELEKLRQQVRQLAQQLKGQEGSVVTTPETANAASDISQTAASPSTATAATNASVPDMAATEAASPPAGTSSATSRASSASVPESVPEPLRGFQLYMEPVVELASRRTWLYRALPALPAHDGRFFLGRHAQLRARALGLAGALQGMIVEHCLRFAAALRARGGSTPVICPVDVAALAHEATSARLRAILQEAGGGHAAPGMLLSLPAEELARASRTARQHVLELAGHVSAFVLEHGGMPEPETPLPLPLAVRYMEAPATALGLARQLPDIGQRLQALQERGMALIASDIDEEHQLEQVRPVAALGRGRLFGAPRRVRQPHEAGSAAPAADHAQAESANVVPMAAMH